MKREGKAGPFIPSKVWVHTGPARATTLAVARRRRRATTAVGARAKAYPLGRQHLRPSGNACAQATMQARGRQCMRPCYDGCRVGGVFFHKHPKLQRSCDDLYARAATPVPGRERMRSGDNAYAWATMSTPVRRRVSRGRGVFSQTPQTSALGRRRLRPGDNVLILVFKRSHFFVLWQSKQNFSIISF